MSFKFDQSGPYMTLPKETSANVSGKGNFFFLSTFIFHRETPPQVRLFIYNLYYLQSSINTTQIVHFLHIC